jgi:hypothetical protein
VAAHFLCRECDGTGWIPYRSETVDGKLEEAYRLCSSCYAPRHCLAFKTDQPCPHPSTVRYGLGYYCQEHIEVIHAGGSADHTREAVYYLRRWLWIARDRANEFLEMQLSEALGKAETRLRRTERELDQACEGTGDPN